MAAKPAIRASVVRDTLAFLDEFEPGAQRRVMERVPAASRVVIERTPNSSWVPIEHDHWTVDAMIELFGTERAIQCWRDSMASLIDRPLLRNFLTGMIAVMGRSPTSVVRVFAKGWPLVYRDLCEPKLIATPDAQPTIRFENIAPEVRRYTNYLYSWQGGCQGFVHIARVQGDVQFDGARRVVGRSEVLLARGRRSARQLTCALTRPAPVLDLTRARGLARGLRRSATCPCRCAKLAHHMQR